MWKSKIGSNLSFIREKRKVFYIAAGIFFIFFLLGILFPDFFLDYQRALLGSRGPDGFLSTFLFILFNNCIIAFTGMITGLLFGVIPLFLLVINGYIIGAIVSNSAQNLEMVDLLVRFLPHGIFEIPAIILSLGFGLCAYDVIFRARTRKEVFSDIRSHLYDSFFLFMLKILPLFILAALIETLLISNMPFVQELMMKPQVITTIRTLLIAFLFYGVIRFLKVYMRKRDIRYMLLLIISLMIASHIWMSAYESKVTTFLDRFRIMTNLLPLAVILIFLYMEHQRYKETKDKEKIKGAFQQYVSPSVISDLMKNPDKLKLGGEKKELTVLFSDIRGFTSICENLTPVQLVHTLNEYLTDMTDTIIENKGVVDKYIGDAIMAFWGAPVDTPNHPELACKSALKMTGRLHTFNNRRKRQGLPEIDIGIGINTGEMIVGNMGSDKRFDYTVMGDSVNLGSRLEGLNKVYGTRIIISEFTYERIKDEFLCRRMDYVCVKGRKEPVKIYELRGYKDYEDKEVKGLISQFEKALDLYTVREFKKAKDIFRKLYESYDDQPSGLFVSRCDELISSPPPEDWDSVYVLKTK